MVAMVVTGERWVLFVVHSFLLTHFNRWCLFVMKLCNDLRILRMVFFRCYLQLIVFVTFAYVITKSVDTISVGGVFLCIFIFLLVISYIFFVHNTWEIIHFLTVKKNCKNTYVFSFWWKISGIRKYQYECKQMFQTKTHKSNKNHFKSNHLNTYFLHSSTILIFK